MELPVLYKRTKSGAIQRWAISVVVEHQDMAPRSAAIVKEAGQLGGKLTSHHEMIREGKNLGKANETTPLQQAEFQAQSDWKKKHDEGYKSLTDLGAEVPFDTIENLHHFLEVLLPEFNTDANGQAKPMLAKTVDWNKVTYPCYVQPKLDGVRCLMVLEPRGTNDSCVTFLSRNGKQYTTLDHITATIPGKDALGSLNIILDGEVYSDELSFQQIVAAVKKQSPDSLKLHFRAYDVVTNELQKERLIAVRTLVHAINSSYISMVDTPGAFSKEDIVGWHNRWVSEGYEGAMIRLNGGHYGQGQRSSHLLKVKEFNEEEFTFREFDFGQRTEDLIAVCHTKTGAEFRAKMIGTAAEKEELYAQMRGKEGKLTVKFFGYTTDGLPRFPIGKAFRDY